MKASYEKPALLVEEYELNTAIATGCEEIVNLGPEDGTYNGTVYTACSYFDTGTYDAENPTYMSFFEGRCSCYLSAGGETVFTS